MANLPPLSLYIHIPWCVRKCPYCDFNSHNAPQSLPQDEYVAALVAQRLAFAPDIEVTLETNPGTVEHGPFTGYRRAGVNRIGFGVQSFDDDARKYAGDAERVAFLFRRYAQLSNVV